MKKLLILISLGISLAQAESSVGYEYANTTYNPEGGSSYSFGMHRFSIFDTSGGLTAGIRGGLNKSAAQTNAEYDARKKMADSGQTYGTYNYSWNQPAPVPTDGELWVLDLGSQGNPLIDPISPSTTDANPPKSVLGVEYSRLLWKYEMAPVSFALNWGFKAFMFSAGKSTDTTMSVPLELSVSSLVYQDTLLYGVYAFGPYGYATSNNPKYNHIELGLSYSFSESWLVTFAYRSTHDQFKKSSVITSIDNTMASLGIKYQF